MYQDMAKCAGRIGYGLGQLGHKSKRVTGQNGSFLNGSQVESGCESGRVEPYFSKKEKKKFLSTCNLSIVYKFLNCN